MTICLTMIVRNEAAVIERCLRSVHPFINSWCIVDTGSSDGTQLLAQKALQDLPGKLHERPWKNFGHNRTECVELAVGMAEYNLTIDADEVLEVRRKHPYELTKDIYIILSESGYYSYGRPMLFKNNGGYRYKGPVHEELIRDAPSEIEKLDGVTCKVLGAVSARGGKEKYRRDAELLKEAIKEEPENSRYWFYLAQSWRDAGEDALAYHAYVHRSHMHGWYEETFIARLEASKLTEKLIPEPSKVIESYERAFRFRPERRAEVLWQLARYLRRIGKPGLGYTYAKMGINFPEPVDDLLFVDVDAYRWKIFNEMALCAKDVGKKTEAADIFKQLLDHGGIPEGEVPRIERELEACLS